MTEVFPFDTKQKIPGGQSALAFFADAIPQKVWVADRHGHFSYLNKQYVEYTGLSIEELETHGKLLIHPDDWATSCMVWRHAMESGEGFQLVHRLRRKDGVYRWHLTQGSPRWDTVGEIILWVGTNIDIDDQKRNEDALRQSQQRVQKLMDANIVGIMVNDSEYIIEANDALLEMVGYTRADMAAGRMNWQEMTPPEYKSLDQAALEELMRHGRCAPFEKEYIRKDGRRIPVLLGIAELQHDPILYVCFVLDISARKALEQRKDDFISMASHELKTPITAIQVQEQLLRRRFQKQGAQDAVEALLKMETQINRLTTLINDLLDVSKMQSGKLAYRQETFDADSFIREAVEAVQQANPDYKIALHGIAQCQLSGDRERLNQVLVNLFNNAIKYSPQVGHIDVFVTTNGNTLTISVRDYGIGIPREQLSKIFERFYRIQDSMHKDFPGLGMGLYISAEIVRHHNGRITVESEEGRGSTFHIMLPLHH